jgi:hypothetical protein
VVGNIPDAGTKDEAWKGGYDLFRGDFFIPSFQGSPEITKIDSRLKR